MLPRLLLLIGLLLSIGSWFIPGLPQIVHLTLSAFGSCLFFVGASACLVTKYYRIPTPNMVFVRTGAGGVHVIRGTGMIVFPTIHKITEVSLELTQIKISRSDSNSLPTRDGQRVGFLGEVNIRVEPNPDSILLVAQHFAGQCSHASLVIEATLQKLVMATDAADFRAGFERFVAALRDTVTRDLAAHGILVESMSISLA